MPDDRLDAGPSVRVARHHMRSCVVESAKRFCDKVHTHQDEPCSTCVYNVSIAHAEFLSALPPETKMLPLDELCAAIRSAGWDA